jgi:predicted phosphodiesterase
MPFLILSDIHANLEALEAVLKDASAVGYDEVLVLGDLVGYGADPGAVIDRVLALEPRAMIRGNHDKVCAGLEPPTTFNVLARSSIEWTRKQLTPAQLTYLSELPEGPMLVTPDLEICHGAPFDEDHYIFDDEDALFAMRIASARVCLFGHTHVQRAFVLEDDIPPDQPAAEGEIRLPPEAKVLINVGSVGQPRDRDARAAYGILDIDRNFVALRRVAYDISAAQKKIRRARLPERLATRLATGT